MRRARFGQLDVVLAGGTDRQGGGDGPLVVLMHGFGASGEDLVPLARVLDVPDDVRFVFPAAPHMLPGGFDQRAWWELDMRRVEAAMMSGRPRDLSVEHPPGLAGARVMLIEALDALQDALGAAPDKTIIGGFSQGSMLATDVVLHTDRPFAGLAVLSGSLLCADVWTPRMPARSAVPVFQSHGQIDPVLGFELAERFCEEWKAAGGKVTFVPFRGQHEIPMPVLDAFARFLRKRLAP